jgi:hypothetical protein
MPIRDGRVGLAQPASEFLEDGLGFTASVIIMVCTLCTTGNIATNYWSGNYCIVFCLQRPLCTKFLVMTAKISFYARSSFDK